MVPPHSQEPQVQASRGGKGNFYTQYHPSDPLGMILLPATVTLSSSGLEVLVPEGRALLMGATDIPWNWKLKVFPGF